MIIFEIIPTNPSEKNQSNWKSSPNKGENKKFLKPPPSTGIVATALLLGVF